MLLYLANESVSDGTEAVSMITDWIQTQFIDDEKTQVWSPLSSFPSLNH